MAGFSAGFNDKLLAKRLGLSYNKVRFFRQRIGITAQQIQENKLDAWENLIKRGVDAVLIGEIYDVKPSTVAMLLFQKRKFSITQTHNKWKEDSREQLKKSSVPLIAPLLGADTEKRLTGFQDSPSPKKPGDKRKV